jgi:hypothetical protein
MAQARLLHLLKLVLFTNGLLKGKSLALHVSSLGRSVDQHLIPSSAVAKDVLLICNYLRMKSGDFLHYILHQF